MSKLCNKILCDFVDGCEGNLIPNHKPQCQLFLHTTIDHPINNGEDGFIEERTTVFMQILTGPYQMQTCNYFI